MSGQNSLAGAGWELTKAIWNVLVHLISIGLIVYSVYVGFELERWSEGCFFLLIAFHPPLLDVKNEHGSASG